MSLEHSTSVLSGPAVEEPLTFEAVDVTGTLRVVARDIQRDVPAGVAARGVAAQLSLPDNVPWSFVGDEGDFLDDNRPIGEQLKAGATVMVAPKAHLG